jgi:hypothetical protein
VVEWYWAVYGPSHNRKEVCITYRVDLYEWKKKKCWPSQIVRNVSNLRRRSKKNLRELVIDADAHKHERIFSPIKTTQNIQKKCKVTGIFKLVLSEDFVLLFYGYNIVATIAHCFSRSLSFCLPCHCKIYDSPVRLWTSIVWALLNCSPSRLLESYAFSLPFNWITYLFSLSPLP